MSPFRQASQPGMLCCRRKSQPCFVAKGKLEVQAGRGSQSCASCLRRYVGDKEAIAHALQQVWPLLEKGFTRHKGNVRAIERYARCPRYALRSSGLFFLPPLLATCRFHGGISLQGLARPAQNKNSD